MSYRGLTRHEIQELAHVEYDLKHAPWCRDENVGRAYRCTCDFFKAIEYNVWKLLGKEIEPSPVARLAWRMFGAAFEELPAPRYVAALEIIGRVR